MSDSKLLANYHQALINRTFHKMIVGAALKDYELIENYSYLFTHAGVEVLDISAFPHSVISAKSGIKQALDEDSSLKEPLIMVSINIGQDPHFRRIELDLDNCTDCLACVPTCPSNAFWVDEKNNFRYNPDYCFGCSNCLPACDFSALSFNLWSPFDSSSLSELSELGAQAIEIHLNDDLEAFKVFYNQLEKNLFELESFCIGSTVSDEAQLIQSANTVIESFLKKYPDEKICLIQVDGEALSGARFSKDAEKDQISITKAKIIVNNIEQKHSEYKDRIFVQVAGGITEKTFSKIRLLNLDVNGIAIGSYARKYLEDKRRELNLDVPQLKEIAQGLILTSKMIKNP
jgi:Fe-S-cluster-containing dehydrogenase component